MRLRDTADMTLLQISLEESYFGPIGWGVHPAQPLHIPEHDSREAAGQMAQMPAYLVIRLFNGGHNVASDQVLEVVEASSFS